MKLLLVLGLLAVISTSTVLARHSHKLFTTLIGSRREEPSENGKPDSDPPNKVKLVKAKGYADPDYFNDRHFEANVIEVNETFSSLETDYKVIKDFPLDTLYSVQVYRAKLGSRHYEHIQDIKFQFCKDFSSKYFEYLPDAIAETAKSGCLPAGFHYKSNDTRYLRFYDLLTVEELKDSKLKMFTNLEYENKLLFSIELDFVSNY